MAFQGVKVSIGDAANKCGRRHQSILRYYENARWLLELFQLWALGSCAEKREALQAALHRVRGTKEVSYLKHVPKTEVCLRTIFDAWKICCLDKKDSSFRHYLRMTRIAPLRTRTDSLLLGRWLSSDAAGASSEDVKQRRHMAMEKLRSRIQFEAMGPKARQQLASNRLTKGSSIIFEKKKTPQRPVNGGKNDATEEDDRQHHEGDDASLLTPRRYTAAPIHLRKRRFPSPPSWRITTTTQKKYLPHRRRRLVEGGATLTPPDTTPSIMTNPDMAREEAPLSEDMTSPRASPETYETPDEPVFGETQAHFEDMPECDADATLRWSAVSLDGHQGLGIVPTRPECSFVRAWAPKPRIVVHREFKRDTQKLRQRVTHFERQQRVRSFYKKKHLDLRD